MKPASSLLATLAFLCLLSNHSQAQKKKYTDWHPSAGLYYAGNPASGFQNASFQFSLDYQINRKWSVGLFSQSLHSRQVYSSFTFGLISDYSKTKHARFYKGFGIVVQMNSELTNLGPSSDRLILPAFRIGYKLPIKYISIIPECLATGPNLSTENLELVSLLAFGIKIRVNRWR